MRISLLIAVCAAFLFAPTVSAQKVVQAWYQLRSGDKVEFVQAETLQMNHLKDKTEVMLNGRRTLELMGPVGVSYAGTGSEPQARGARSGSISVGGGDFDGGGGTHTEVEVVIDADGTSNTKTTTTRTENDGSQTTTTTTTTTTTSGETTSTTETTST